MKNSEYWQERFIQLEEAQNKKAAILFQEIERQYRQAQKEIEGIINTWYQRFAVNNGISMSEARKLLAGKDLKEFKWDVAEYIQHGKESNINGVWLKELENASARFHISKLEALNIHLRQSLEILFAKQDGKMKPAMEEIFKSSYYHTAYEIQKGTGIGWDIASLDQAQIEKLLAMPWAPDGYNFSERLWNNKEKLIATINTEITKNIMLGGSPQKAIDSIAHKMKTSRSNAGRLVMTEEAYFSSLAQGESFKDLEVEQYEIVATLDKRTSSTCRELDGNVFKLKEYKAGATAPPFHVYCRSTTVPYFEDDEVGERIARNKDGQLYSVPADMKYPEWKKSLVDGNNASLNLQQINTNGIMKKKEFSHLKGLTDSFEVSNVSFREVQEHSRKLNEADIISMVGGADKTDGSCASVGLAYIGQKYGFNVLDFRDGVSREWFASKLNKIKMWDELGIKYIKADKYKTCLANGKLVLQSVEQGKEYYLSVGRHAAIVRKNEDDILQYLELQSSRCGWKNFSPYIGQTLKKRFGCASLHGTAYLTDISQCEDNNDFIHILGYLNTAEDMQKKGVGGYAK